MTTPGAALRAQIARSLVSVLARGRSLKAEFAEVLPTIADSRDRALYEATCFAALRHRRRFELAIASWLAKPLPERDFNIHCLLLCGLAQLVELGLPVHAAVAATVEAARLLGRPALVGLVNALLRRAAREPLPQGESLGERHSHPDWLVTAIANDWPDEVASILESNNRPAPLWLRINRRLMTRDAYLATLQAEGGSASAPTFPEDALRIDAHLSPELLPGWQDGALLVQDGAAQLAVEALAPQPGEHVLDACAAPGGKCAQIAVALANKGSLLAIDVDARRLRKVGQTLSRLQLDSDIVTIRCADATQPQDWAQEQLFDAILLDAPCSATGIIRRQPDIKWHRRADDIAVLVAHQAQLLDCLWPLLRPGGRLLYATCSLLKAENAQQIANFLQRTTDAQAVMLDDCYGRSSGAGRQRFPGEDGMDGFFYALLKKQA